jgi:ATP-dependent protease ClpP protease subunit
MEEITNWLHSLFVIKKEEKYKKNNLKETVWLFEKIPAHNLYRLYIQEFLYWWSKNEEESKNKINNIFNELQESDNKLNELEIRISSRWWYLDELTRFENIIDKKFNWKTTTILDNHWFSCWAMLFLKWDKRLIHENSHIMFHYYSGWIYWKGWEVNDQADCNKVFYEKYFTKILKPYFTNKEIKELLIWKDYWIEADEMIKRWIATWFVN